MGEYTLGNPTTSVAVLEALDRVRRMGDGADLATGAKRSWRSFTRAEVVYSGPGKDPRDPQKLGISLATLTKKFGWETQLDVGELMGRWPQLVGANVAEHCVPVVCEPPKLVVRASSSTWATQMRVMSMMLLDRLEKELGRRIIDEIEILGPTQKSWKRGRRSVKGRGPRDTYG